MKDISHAHRGGGESEKTRQGREGAATPALYALLAFAWCLIFALGAAALCYLMRAQLNAWHPSLTGAAFLLLAVPVAACACFLILEVLSFSANRDLLGFIPFAPRRVLIMALFPLCRMLGGLIGQSRDVVSASCIAFNNRIARWAKKRAAGGKLLVLLPRCVQRSECRQDLIASVINCQRCGRCAIAHLVGLMEKHSFAMAVVTGGELARKIVLDLAPSSVIAIACESELIKGLQEISRIPVIAIPNRRPEGPCRDTVIDLEKFERALHSMATPCHADQGLS